MAKSIKHYIKRVKDGAIKDIATQLRWVYSYAKDNRGLIVLYTVLGLSGIVVSLISSLVSRDLVDIITGHRTGALVITFLSMIGITLLSTAIGQISSYLSTKISLHVDNHIKASVFDDIMVTEWEELDKYHSGDLIARWNGDVSVVSNGILTLFPNALIFTFQFISALYMVIRYDASFAIFALASVPISLFTSRESLKRMQKGNMSSLQAGTRMSSFNQETFSNIQTVKAFDMVKLYSKRLRVLQEEYKEVRLKYQRITIINAIILTIVSLLVTYSAQGWGIYKVWNGSITYGTMTMFITLSTTLSGTVNNLINLFPSGILFSNAAKRLMSITGLEKEDYSNKEEAKEFYEKNESQGVGVCVRDLTYAYPGGENVLENISIEAHPHEVIALVGPSGEGKTTLLRYLLALIRPKEGFGYICAGNSQPEDNNYINLSASIRQLIAYVPQGNTMFSGTIAQNMRNVKENATDEEIVDALKLACAWNFVKKLPGGINSEIKENGGGFSEGQSQRLSIARALLRRSPILLLDEATSALDMITERKVLQNIMNDKYARTCIVTTHRPTVLGICNRVYLIHDKQCDILTEEEITELTTMPLLEETEKS